MDFGELFRESNGEPITYKNKVVIIGDKVILPTKSVSLLVEFISTKSEYKQGIVLGTNKGDFEIDGERLPTKRIIMWETAIPKQVKVTVNTKDKILFVYNAWESTNHLGNKVTDYGYYGAAMIAEKVNETTTIYHCNDGYPDDDFDDLIFKVEIEPVL